MHITQKYIDSINGLTELWGAAAFFIKEVVGNDAARSVNIFGVKERLEPVAPLLVLAVYQNESTQKVLLLLIYVHIQQVWMACLVIRLGNLVFV